MKILYEGVDIYPDVSVHRCYHDMYAEKQSDELLLKLNDTRELWDSWNPKKGRHHRHRGRRCQDGQNVRRERRPRVRHHHPAGLFRPAVCEG